MKRESRKFTTEKKKNSSKHKRRHHGGANENQKKFKTYEKIAKWQKSFLISYNNKCR